MKTNSYFNLSAVIHGKHGIWTIGLLIYLILFSCTRKTDTFYTPEYNPLISAFTSGVISSGSVIKIQLSTDLEDFNGGGTRLRDKIFEFTPAIKGNAYIVDSRTIEFRPDKPLPSGTQFISKFYGSKLFKKNKEIKDFTFSFRTIPLNIDVLFDGLRTYSKADMSLNEIQGKIVSTDRLYANDVETLISANQGIKNLPIKWIHQEDGKVHYFTVDSVKRTEKRELVIMKWKGKGFAVEGSKEYEIPALNEFVLLEQKVIQYPEQHIMLVFSDPLKTNQKPDGLIYLENFTDLRFTIEENILKAYPVIRQKGSLKLTVGPGIQNVVGKKFAEEKTFTIDFESLKPAVRLVGKGVIIPGNDGLFFPFEAVNLKGIDVKIIKIFENNIGHFLQFNNIDGDYELKRAGRLIVKRSIDLTADRPINYGEWNTFSLDLSTLVETEPGALYRVELDFRRKHSLYECAGISNSHDISEDTDENRITEKDLTAYDLQGYYDWGDYDYSNYDWLKRDDPCDDAYYVFGNKVGRNILASDIGIIAKSGNDKSLLFAVTSLITTEPLQNVKLDVYNFQRQLIASLLTDKNGIAEVTTLESTPFLVIASKDRQRGYLRLDPGSSLSFSRFDISGTSVNKGVKGFIYGERGVWRPGDTVFITFILEDKNRLFPVNHPVSLEWTDPQGRRIATYTALNGLNGFYGFKIPTKSDDPTGNWNAKITAGNLMFSQNFRIESVKPNRLSINLDFGTDEIMSESAAMVCKLKSNWLHGAPASDLKSTVSMNFKSISTSYKGFSDYVFTDPSRSFVPVEQEIYNGTLDQNGNASFRTSFNIREQSPGKVNAIFTTRVFEKGGDFSTDIFSIPYSPYAFYTGLKSPEGDRYGILPTDTLHKFEIVTLDENGAPADRKNLQIFIYKLAWKWWWHTGEENLASYIGSSYYKPVYEQKLSTVNGRASFKFGVDYPDWGRFYVRVYDPSGKHSAGKIVYFDYPGWSGRADRENPAAASMLSFSSSKNKYAPGETAVVTIPTGIEGRLFLSIENGTKVLKYFWVNPTAGETTFSFTVTKEMAPNIFVNIFLIQPHKQSVNDLPVRMYGIIPLLVEDPDTRLMPVLKIPEILRPSSDVEITVSENSGREMTYTLAMIDEGLLNLTRFKTPNPWDVFYSKEALGVNSFDFYDYVLGSYGGRIDGIFSIGGDEDALIVQEGGKANRFTPVVKFIGPFHLPAKKSHSHKLYIPEYAGSLRTMIVAGNKGAYGSAEKSVSVRNPLMILTSLPRVLGPAETVSLPVSVFATEDHVREVDLLLEYSNNFSSDTKKQKVFFTRTGDAVTDFVLKTKEVPGKGKIRVTAISGKETAVSETEIDIRSPNPDVTTYIYGIAEPGKTWTADYTLPGVQGTNTGTLEVSSLPPLDLGRRLKFLFTYPHSCAEQIVSGAFPRLFLPDIMDVNDKMKTQNKSYIETAIEKLCSMQLTGGGIALWPGSAVENEWITSYAGHFILEAKKKGYLVPADFLTGWLRFQKQAARNWSIPLPKTQAENVSTGLTQAYRLFTLALAGEPETGAMNRLREYTGMSTNTMWRLAAAYALAGQPESARKMAGDLTTRVPDYYDPGETYGSQLRDMAMILEAMVLIGEKERSVPLLQEISDQLSSNSWFSTQSTAYAIMAVSAFGGGIKTSDELKYEFSIDNQPVKYATSKSSYSIIDHAFIQDGTGIVKVINKGDGLLYMRLTLNGIPLPGKEKTYSSNLSLTVNYVDMQGQPLNISKLDQGTDFMAVVSVYNPGNLGNYKDMALTQIFPSGWEIQNIRLFESNTGSFSRPDYQDIRDDRVITYFSIGRGKREQFAVKLNSAYKGRYYLPAIHCEAMYRKDINAFKEGQWVEVTEAGKEKATYTGSGSTPEH